MPPQSAAFNPLAEHERPGRVRAVEARQVGERPRVSPRFGHRYFRPPDVARLGDRLAGEVVHPVVREEVVASSTQGRVEDPAIGL